MTTVSPSLRDTLLIHWRGDQQALDWLRVDGAGRIGLSQREHAPPASVLAAVRQILVLAPSESISLLTCNLPARNAEQALQAAPFAVEEQIAGNVDALHFAVAARGPGTWCVAAAEPALLQQWLAALAARGIVPDCISPDVLALRAGREHGSVLVDGDRALVALPGDRAFVVDSELLDSVLPDESELHIERRHVEAGGSALSVLAAGAARAGELNLLTGGFAPAHRGADLRQRWARIGWIAAAALVLALVHLKLDEVRLDRRVQALNAEMERVYRARFPEAQSVPNPLAQMRNAVKAATGGSGNAGAGLDLLSLSAPVLASQAQISLQGVEYRAGVLSLRLSAPSIEALDGLRESLAATPGLKATLETAETQGEAVEGRIKLEARA
jgi:general secretion pathway protein L